MDNTKSKIRRTTFFTTAILLTITIQLVARSYYPAFEARAFDFYVERMANSPATTQLTY